MNIGYIESFIKAHKKQLLKIFVAVMAFAMIFKGIMQQPQIAQNKKEIARLNEQIEYEKQRQEEIDQMRQKVNTDEYIEKIAEEKLGLVKNNVKIFVDVSSGEQ